MMGGLRWKMDRDLELAAWMMANLMNVWTKKKVTPKMLLKKSNAGVPMGKDDVATSVRQRDIRELWRRQQEHRRRVSGN